VPINVDRIEGGQSPDPRRLITDFLRSNPRYAYTLEELVEALASRKVNLRKEEVQKSLNSLEEWGWAKTKVVDGVKYYSHKVIGFRP